MSIEVKDIRPPAWGKSSLDRVNYLKAKGVDIPIGPERVFISPEVNPDRIESGVVLYNVDIYGEDTAIGAGTRLGQYGRVVLINTLLGRKVTVGDGVLGTSGSGRVIMLDQSGARFGNEIRPNTVMEEEAEIGRSNGLKNTFLGYASVVGSLSDFCDAALLGGTNRQSDHSEVGSVSVHANFDQQGKKWGSWFGPVPQGIFLKKPLIFLGAGSTFVAPLLVNFGVMSVAGNVLRSNVLEEGVFVSEPALPKKSSKYKKGCFGRLIEKIQTTAIIIGNYKALAQWYRFVRIPYFKDDPLQTLLMERIYEVLNKNIEERIGRLESIISDLPGSIAIIGEEKASLKKEQELIIEKWEHGHKNTIKRNEFPEADPLRQEFLESLPPNPTKTDYASYIKALEDSVVQKGVLWLQAVVECNKVDY